jgi:hypothetical protein
MEKRWDSARPLPLQTITTGLIVAAGLLLLPALGLAVDALAREVGTLIGEAVATIVRDIFSALGVFVPRHVWVELCFLCS